MNVQLCEQILDVAPDRIDRYPQRLSNLATRETATHELSNFYLTRSKTKACRKFVRAESCRGDGIDEYDNGGAASGPTPVHEDG